MAYYKNYHKYKNTNDNEKTTKESVEEISNKMEDDLVNFLKEGNFEKIIKSCSGTIGRYSGRNQILLKMQSAIRGKSVSSVMTNKQWGEFIEDLNEKNPDKKIPYPIINKGEKAYKIFRPNFQTYGKYYENLILKEKEKDESKRDYKKIEELEKKLEEVKAKGLADKRNPKYQYKQFSVFDISQYENISKDDVYESLGIYQLDKDQTIENEDAIIRGITNKLTEKGYSVEYGIPSSHGEGGYCVPSEKRIVICDNKTGIDRLHVLVHETGHALAHTNPRKDFKGLSENEVEDIREVEAESISCIVCTYLGLDVQNMSTSYIAGWSEADLKKFVNNLYMIQDCASEIIDSINKELDKVNNRTNLAESKTYIEDEDTAELEEISEMEMGE